MNRKIDLHDSEQYLGWLPGTKTNFWNNLRALAVGYLELSRETVQQRARVSLEFVDSENKRIKGDHISNWIDGKNEPQVKSRERCAAFMRELIRNEKDIRVDVRPEFVSEPRARFLAHLDDALAEADALDQVDLNDIFAASPDTEVVHEKYSGDYFIYRVNRDETMVFRYLITIAKKPNSKGCLAVKLHGWRGDIAGKPRDMSAKGVMVPTHEFLTFVFRGQHPQHPLDNQFTFMTAKRNPLFGKGDAIDRNYVFGITTTVSKEHTEVIGRLVAFRKLKLKPNATLDSRYFTSRLNYKEFWKDAEEKKEADVFNFYHALLSGKALHNSHGAEPLVLDVKALTTELRRLKKVYEELDDGEDASLDDADNS